MIQEFLTGSALLAERIENLTKHLNDALRQPSVSYDFAKNMDTVGIYIVILKKQIIYVGKTTRTGKIRLGEMVADFRSHTLNKKLFKEHAISLGIKVTSLTNATKKEWIENKICTEEEFKGYQKTVNLLIKKKCSFKFYKCRQEELGTIEHFFISILQTKYND